MAPKDELVSALWKTADVLRGTSEIAQWAHPIFCLLVLRHASEASRFHTRSEKRPPGPKHARERSETWLSVPENARWSWLAAHSAQDTANTLRRACKELEKANPELDRVLTSVDFKQIDPCDKHRRDRLLAQMIAGISTLPSSSVASSTSIGEACDWFIAKSAEQGGKASGEFFTPPSVLRLMVELLDLRDGMRVCDPACRAGGALTQCAQYASEKRIRIELHGQEWSDRVWRLCKMNLVLHGIHGARIEPGDVLRSPKLIEGGHLIRYDRVITAPPFSRSNWGAEEAANDPFARFPLIPPKDMADYAYVQHCLASLHENGVAVILTSRGVLFRGGSDERIRKKLLEEDHFEAVIGLPGGLLHGTNVPAALLILRAEKPVAHRKKVLLIEVPSTHDDRERRSSLSERHAGMIVDAVRDYSDKGSFARIVHLDEIETHNWSLNTALYLLDHELAPSADLQEQFTAIKQAEIRRDAAAERINMLVQKLQRGLGFDS